MYEKPSQSLNKTNEPLKGTRSTRTAQFSLGQIIFWGATLAMAIALFAFVRILTDCFTLASLPGIPPDICFGSQKLVIDSSGASTTATPEKNGLVQTESAPQVEAPQWDGASRINILFIGLRNGGASPSGEDCPLCTDTLILLTLDPVSKTAGIVSVPRDLWVNIPGFGFSRINTAYTSGEIAKLPGGGPGLAMKTVSQTIGVPIQYYVWVDFNTFVSIINLIGGVDVQNYERLRLDPLGNGKDKVILTPGLRHLSGPIALAYARCRTVNECGAKGGDADRSRRQQLVIFGIRDKIFSPAYFPKLIAQAPQLYRIFGAGIHTNLSLDDAIKLAFLAKDIPTDRIRSAVIDIPMVAYERTTLAGLPADVMRPVPDKIRILVDEIFTATGAASPIAQGDPESLMKVDGARVRVLNGTYISQLDTRTGNFLISKGMQITQVGSANGLYDQTTIIVYSPKLYALRYLISVLGIKSGNQIRFKLDPRSTVDLEVDLGTDWQSKLPAGF